MSPLETLLTSRLANLVGWVFLHFLWEGVAIAGALGLALIALRSRSSNTRYAACLVAMGAMLAAPIATFVVLSGAFLPHAALDVGPAGVALSPANRVELLAPLFALFWVVGALLQQARMLLTWLRVQRLRRRGARLAPNAWQEALDSMRAALGVRVPVRLLESASVRVPTVVGWVSPVVLVPASAFLRLAPEQLRMVLAHELAHIRRHDYLVNLVQVAVEALFFFHPAIWWLSHRLRAEREYCCDDLAVGLSGDPLGYARALERLESLRCGDSRLVLASTGGNLMKRIQRLIRPEIPPRGGFTLGALPLALLAAAGLTDRGRRARAPGRGARPRGTSGPAGAR